MLDVTDQLAIQTLFACYCHRVDHGDGPGWAALFTPQGRFEVSGAMTLLGHDELAGMPAIVAQHGSGKWRHQVTNIVAVEGETPDTAHISAYGLVTDWGNGGKLSSFTDYEIELRRVADDWKIERLSATLV